ncbi:unnamed protein product [Effrenium voratum]|uniref:Uncharacterized protein n=1 Tax=Effrenium voratum TaxID=2562239 RepID=A0AA36IVI9_9DINO|nr:unnamed protein product [Effrenium voratum]CAJ1418616.1 unnamed protein product [Effrenium voratum]
MVPWVDVHTATRRTREKVIASTFLPYWNAEGIFRQLPESAQLGPGSPGTPGPAPDRAKVAKAKAAPGSHRAQPKQGRPAKPKPRPTAAALRGAQSAVSAGRLAAEVRGQLLQLCAAAGLEPPELQGEVARAPPTPTPAPVAPAMSAPPRRRSLASQLRLAAQQRAREELELRRAQRHCRAAGTQTEEVYEICLRASREEPLKPKCAEALLDHHWHVAPVAPSHAPPFQELWVADAPHGHVAEPDIVVGEGQVTSTSGSPASPPLPQLEAMSTWEVVPALPQGVMASSQVPHVWHPAPSPPTVPDDSPGRDFASSPRAFLPARLPPFAAPRAPPSDRGATATDKATACDYDVSVLEALRRKGARTPMPGLDAPSAQAVPTTETAIQAALGASAEMSAREAKWEEDLTRPAPDDGLSGSPGSAPKPPESPAASSAGTPPPSPPPAPGPPPSSPGPGSSPDTAMADGAHPPSAGRPSVASEGEDASPGREDLMDDLPVLPAYRPLPPLDDTPVPAAGTPAAPQLAPRQLEQQFYSSLQILDSVQAHLTEVDLLAQHKALRQQHRLELEAQSRKERKEGLEAQVAQQAQLESALAWLEAMRRSQQQLLEQFQCSEASAAEERAAWRREMAARELQRQEEADLLEVERLEKEQSILERRRELLLLLGGGFQT